LILFALAGLSLAVVGVYGVISFLAAQRRQELAVRMAIGASRVGVFWLVLRQSIAIAVAGAAIGLVGAFAAQKLTSGILFGISPLDPLTFAGGALFLVGVAAIAGTIPSVRVMRIDPALTLRQD
jgi:putative ABC transport system permease protein